VWWRRLSSQMGRKHSKTGNVQRQHTLKGLPSDLLSPAKPHLLKFLAPPRIAAEDLTFNTCACEDTLNSLIPTKAPPPNSITWKLGFQ
jgi:hypothetical protein